MHEAPLPDTPSAGIGPAHEACRLAESVEMSAWRDLAAAVPPNLTRDTRFEALEVAGALALRAPRLGSVLFNRALGLGIDRPADNARILELLHAYRDAGIDNFWIHASPAAEPGDLAARLRSQGLTAYRRSWTKFVRGPDAVRAVHCDLPMRKATLSDGEAVAEILAPAFDMPLAGGRLLASVIGRPRWHVGVVHDAGRPVAVGGLYIDGSLAYLAFAATRPAWRRRGAQSALMHRRVLTALAHGCTLIATETGTPLHAEEPNPSYGNMLRFGFHRACVRDNYGPPGTQWRSRAPGR